MRRRGKMLLCCRYQHLIYKQTGRGGESKKMNKKILAIVLICVFLITIICPSISADSSVSVKGKVTHNGMPVSGATIYISISRASETCETNARGRYSSYLTFKIFQTPPTLTITCSSKYGSKTETIPECTGGTYTINFAFNTIDYEKPTPVIDFVRFLLQLPFIEKLLLLLS